MTREERLAKQRERQTTEQTISRKEAYAIPSNINRYTVKEGENRIDILPYKISNPLNPAVHIMHYEVGEIDYFQQLEIHKDIGSNSNMYLCAKRMFGEKCYICDEQKALYDAQEKDKAKKLYPTTYAIYNVIDLDEPEKGVQIWFAPYNWVEKELRNLAAMKSKRGDMILFGDWEVGKTIVFYGVKENFRGRTFIKPSNFTFEERENKYTESICEKTYPLDQWYVVPKYEEVEADYLQIPTNNQSVDTAKDADYDTAIKQKKSERDEQKLKFEEMSKADEEFLEKNTTLKSEPEKVTEQTQPSRRRRESNKCPFAHEFGVDFDRHADCTKCDDTTYDKCGEAYDSINV